MPARTRPRNCLIGTVTTTIPTPATSTHLTRRAALEAERAAARRPSRPTRTTSPNLAAPTSPMTRRRPAAPSLVASTGAAAVLVLFASAALPAHTAAAGSPDAVIAPAAAGQSLTVAASALDPSQQRDGFTVTTPAAAAQPGSAPLADVSAAGTVQWPFLGGAPLSSGFGYRVAPCATCSTNHQGFDLVPGAGTPIQVVADGVVRIAGRHSEFGQYAVIDHRVNGRLVSTLYAHMIIGSSPLSAGQSVAAGDLVGLVGSSGRSTGAHLHFEVHANGTTPIDPATWLRSNAAATS